MSHATVHNRLILVVMLVAAVPNVGTDAAESDSGQPASRGAEFQGGETRDAVVETLLRDTVVPFLAEHCYDCHGASAQEAKLDLRPYSTVESLSTFHQSWEEVAHRIESGEMPPPEAGRPDDGERDAVVSAIDRARRTMALAAAGDHSPTESRRIRQHDSRPDRRRFATRP